MKLPTNEFTTLILKAVFQDAGAFKGVARAVDRICIVEFGHSNPPGKRFKMSLSMFKK